MSTDEKINEMIEGLEKWLQLTDYNYWGCNNVPVYLFGSNKKWNNLIRTFFRLCPINFRGKGTFPITPQANVVLLKAFIISQKNDRDNFVKIYKRVLSLRSPKTKHFALKQGIKISISLYEDSPEDPTPLNTVWFGQSLLSDQFGLMDEEEKKQILVSIAQYLTEELGYKDFEEKGIYFYYGHHLTKIVYNASAIISSFLIKVGIRYQLNDYLRLGRLGIRFIVENQNSDGSWFYAAPPSSSTIDCFHQSYIIQALMDCEQYLDFPVRTNIDRAVDYYKTLFIKTKKYVKPVRYDKRYSPKNTWLFVQVDGRDVAEGLVFFSTYCKDSEMVKGLIDYLYAKFFNKRRGCFAPEIFVYGKNKIPYIEFQAWFLYALKKLKTK